MRHDAAQRPATHHDVFEVVGVLVAQRHFQGPRNRNPRVDFAVADATLPDLRDAIVVFVIMVESQLIVHPKANQHRHGHAHGQSADVDEGVALVTGKVAVGDF